MTTYNPTRLNRSSRLSPLSLSGRQLSCWLDRRQSLAAFMSLVVLAAATLAAGYGFHVAAASADDSSVKTGERSSDLAAPLDGQRVFYTGHSFHMFVPPQLEQLVKSAGIANHKLAGAQGIGGSRVIQHWDLADDKNKAKPALTSGQVDVFTMAAHLQIPDDGISNFTELGLKHNPNLRLLFQASWFPFDVADPTKRVRENSQRDQAKVEDLQAAVDDWRKKLEAQVDNLNRKHERRAVYIVPVGDAVVKLRAMIIAGKFPGIEKQSELFTDPIGHGKGQIQALATYCNFAAIYRRNPEGLTLNVAGVDAAQHAILQKLAWETVSQYPYAGLKAK